MKQSEENKTDSESCAATQSKPIRKKYTTSKRRLTNLRKKSEQHFTREELQNELWLPLPYNNQYSISNLGRVKRDNKFIVCKHSHRKLGHVRFQPRSIDGTKQKDYYLKDIVAELFLTESNCPPEYGTVKHIDRDRSNNRVDNLYVVPREHDRDDMIDM